MRPTYFISLSLLYLEIRYEKNSFKNMLFPKRVLYQLIVCTRTHLREGFIMEVRKQRWRVSSPNHVVPLNQMKVIWIGNNSPFSLRCVISHVLTSICAFIFPFFSPNTVIVCLWETDKVHLEGHTFEHYCPFNYLLIAHP